MYKMYFKTYFNWFFLTAYQYSCKKKMSEIVNAGRFHIFQACRSTGRLQVAALSTVYRISSLSLAQLLQFAEFSFGVTKNITESSAS